MKIVFCGLSITSSRENGHATNYRALVRELSTRGHEVVFCEREAPWSADHRDLPDPPWGRTSLYASLEELKAWHTGDVAEADLVVVGSHVPEGVDVCEWALRNAGGATAFYDVDTPATIDKLRAGDRAYLSPELVDRFDVYLSFSGGPTIEVLEEEFGARHAVAFHCLVDPDAYRPAETEVRWGLGYLGTCSAGRQPALERLLAEPAALLPGERFAVAGPEYPEGIHWPANVDRIEPVAPAEYSAFYAAQRFTLNVTPAQLRRAGWSPSVRLFEAAACGVPVISDRWDGLDELFEPDTEILVADGAEDVVDYLREVSDEERRALGERARQRVLAEHTATRRCEQLEEEVSQVMVG